MHPVGQRRGRAQKKRAKKIKDKMRELCLEAAAAAAVSAPAANAGEENASVNQGPHTFSDVSERGLADCSDGNQSVGNQHGNRETSDTQGLQICPRFVRAATDLVAMAQVRAPCQRCFKTPVLLASESASSSSKTEDTVAVARAATGAAATPAALSCPSPEPLQIECVCGNGTGAAMKETGGSFAASGSRKGLSSVDPPCDADELPPTSVEGNGTAFAKGVRKKAHVLKNRSRGEALESAGSCKEGPLDGSNAVPHYKKTRRGKRAGGASNRRRGHKANAKVISGETPDAANDAGQGEGKAAGLTVVPLIAHEEGLHGDRNSPEDMASYGDNRRNQDGVCRCTSSSSVDIAAMECAALTSLRYLRSMIGSPTTARSQKGVDSLEESCLQSSGVLESLVALCAPYPWEPIPLLHGDFPRGLSVRAWETPEDAGAHGKVENAVETQSRSVSSVISAGGVHVDDAVNATVSRNGATRTKAAVCSGLRGAGSREAVMEGALRTLSTAFEEPKNRDYVLRIDGATPLVRTRTTCIQMFTCTTF